MITLTCAMQISASPSRLYMAITLPRNMASRGQYRLAYTGPWLLKGIKLATLSPLADNIHRIAEDDMLSIPIRSIGDPLMRIANMVPLSGHANYIVLAQYIITALVGLCKLNDWRFELTQ